MVKIETEKEKITVMAKADFIKDKILRDKELFEFRQFIAGGFQIIYKDNKRIQNKDRDLALVCHILDSDLRVSEALSLDLPDIDWLEDKVLVTRKGNKKISPYKKKHCNKRSKVISVLSSNQCVVLHFLPIFKSVVLIYYSSFK